MRMEDFGEGAWNIRTFGRLACSCTVARFIMLGALQVVGRPPEGAEACNSVQPPDIFLTAKAARPLDFIESITLALQFTHHPDSVGRLHVCVP